MISISTRPRPAASATADPLIPAKNTLPRMFIWPEPPSHMADQRTREIHQPMHRRHRNS